MNFNTAKILRVISLMSVSILVLTSFLISQETFAQYTPNIDEDYRAKTDDWRFIIAPYAMLASQATNVGTKQLRQSFSDLSSLTNFGFQMMTTVMYKEFALTADGTYANLGTDGVFGPISAELDLKQYMLDLRLGYLVLNDANYKTNRFVVDGWALEVNAGAKYWRNDVKVYSTVTLPDPLPAVYDTTSTDQYWWDPMLGVKARIFLSKTVLLGLHFSYGGFGIGSASKYSWDFQFTNTFKVSKLILVSAGYRSFRYKRIDPSEDGDIETKVAVYGPQLGVSFVF